MNMSKRSVFTTITPLPTQISRSTALACLHSHTEMIDLNPLVIDRHPTISPANASLEEHNCTWYSITDRISYFPSLPSLNSTITYLACFHDLADGLHTHVYAPAGLDIREKWSVGRTDAGEASTPMEMGLGGKELVGEGLYLREDVDMRCNFALSGFVKRTLVKAHEKLIARLVVMAELEEATTQKERRSERKLVDRGIAMGGSVNCDDSVDGVHGLLVRHGWSDGVCERSARDHRYSQCSGSSHCPPQYRPSSRQDAFCEEVHRHTQYTAYSPPLPQEIGAGGNTPRHAASDPNMFAHSIIHRSEMMRRLGHDEYASDDRAFAAELEGKEVFPSSRLPGGGDEEDALDIPTKEMIERHTRIR